MITVYNKRESLLVIRLYHISDTVNIHSTLDSFCGLRQKCLLVQSAFQLWLGSQSSLLFPHPQHAIPNYCYCIFYFSNSTSQTFRSMWILFSMCKVKPALLQAFRWGQCYLPIDIVSSKGQHFHTTPALTRAHIIKLEFCASSLALSSFCPRVLPNM